MTDGRPVREPLANRSEAPGQEVVWTLPRCRKQTRAGRQCQNVATVAGRYCGTHTRAYDRAVVARSYQEWAEQRARLVAEAVARALVRYPDATRLVVFEGRG